MFQLSLDVLICIFSCLRLSRDPYESEVKTLANCMLVNSLFRDAASIPSLWEGHYKIKYSYSDPQMEKARREKYGNNWGQLYIERSRLDAIMLRSLENMVVERVGRYEHAERIARLSLDVWDALQILTQFSPVPAIFSDTLEQRAPRPHALTRNYWANSMSRILMMRHGYEIFEKTKRNETSFEEMMSSLSCFFGVSPDWATSRLEALARDCRQFLEGQGVVLDPEDTNYDVTSICRRIIQFMLDQGYGPMGHDYHIRHILSLFPHGYLATNKKTIPISLIHIFVAIATRLGIHASPVNFPNIVIARVVPQNPASAPFYINAFVTDASECVMQFQNSASLNYMMQSGTLPLDVHLLPAKSSSMLVRAARNILAACRMVTDFGLAGTAMYVPLCVHMLFEADNQTVAEILEGTKLEPLESATFLLDVISPTLNERLRDVLEPPCNEVLVREAGLATIIKHRHPENPIKFFAGMPFTHRKYSYTGIIVGWDSTCQESEEWMAQMSIDSLSRGRRQPFYHSLTLDGFRRYVAEENIQPLEYHEKTLIQNFLDTNSTLPIYFDNAEVHFEEGSMNRALRGRFRFLQSAESRNRYPDDNEVGALWLSGGNKHT